MTDLVYWTRRVNRRQVLRSAALGSAGLAGAALLGCSSGASKQPATGASTGASPSAKTGTPKAGGRFSEVMDAAPTNFDMYTNTSNIATHAISPCTNQLVQFDPDDAWEKPARIKPDLATSWEMSPDGLTYIFKLVQNAKFHDGQPFTSADVVASLDRNLNPPKGYSPARGTQLKPIKSLEAPDAHTFVMKLSRPSAAMLSILAQGFTVMYSERDLKGTFDYKTKINGTGPFRLREYKTGTEVILDKNKDYHVPNRPYLDGHHVYYVPDPATQLAQTLSGNILMNDRVFPADQDAVQKSQGDKFTYPRIPVLSLTALTIQTKRAPMNDARVRLALALVLDRNEGIQVLASGVGTVGGYMLPGGSWALSKEEFAKLPGCGSYSEANVAEAKKLMAAAGVPANRKLVMMAADATDHQRNVTYVTSQVSKLGWNVSADIQDNATIRTRSIAGDFEMTARNVAGAIDDADTWYPVTYLKGAPSNYSKTDSQVVEDLFAKQSVEVDPKKRFELVTELQKASIGQLGDIPIYWRSRHAVLNKVVKDYTVHHNNYNNHRYENVWLDK